MLELLIICLRFKMTNQKEMSIRKQFWKLKKTPVEIRENMIKNHNDPDKNNGIENLHPHDIEALKRLGHKKTIEEELKKIKGET